MAEPTESFYEARARKSRERVRQLLGEEAPAPAEAPESPLPGSTQYEAARLAARARGASSTTPDATAPPPAAQPEAPPLPEVRAPADFSGAYDAPTTGQDMALPEEHDAPKRWWQRVYDVIDPITLSPAEILDPVVLDPDEVWGEGKSPEERRRASDAELRRQLAQMSPEERDGMLALGDKQQIAQAVAAREIAKVTGDDPSQAFSIVRHRGATGWDLQGDYRKLVEAHERRRIRDLDGPMTEADRRRIRAEAQDEADETMAKILMLDTGHYAVVMDPKSWREDLQSIPHAGGFGTLLRYGKALASTPTSRVYEGTESRLSASKWEPLDIFGKAAISTPIGAALARTEPGDLTPSLLRSLPQFLAGPFGGMVESSGDAPSFYDRLIDPETSALVVEGADMATVLPRLGRLVKTDPLLSKVTSSPFALLSDTALGLWVGMPLMLLEPDAISAVFAPAGLARDALTASRVASGVGKVEALAGAAAEGERLASLGETERRAVEVAKIARKHPESYLLANDEALVELAQQGLGGGGSWATRTQQAEKAAREATARKAAVLQELRDAEKAAGEARMGARVEALRTAAAQAEYDAALAEAMRIDEGLKAAKAWEDHLAALTAAGGPAVAGARKVPKGKASLERFSEVEAALVGQLALGDEYAETHRKIADAVQAGDMATAKKLSDEMAERIRRLFDESGAARPDPNDAAAVEAARARHAAEVRDVSERMVAAQKEAVEAAKLRGPATAEGRATAQAAAAAAKAKADALTEEWLALLKSPPGASKPLRELLSEYEQLRPFYLLDQAKQGAAAGRKALKEALVEAGKRKGALKARGRDGARLAAEAEKRVKQLNAALDKLSATEALPNAYYQALAKAFRRQRMSFEALLRLPRRRPGSAVRLEQAADVDTATPLVLEPSRLGVSRVGLREGESWERVLDSAGGKVAPDGTYTVTPEALIAAADRAYGKGTLEAWLREAGTPEAHTIGERIFLASNRVAPGAPATRPAGWEKAPVTFTTEQAIALQRGWEQLHKFAPEYLSRQAGLSEARTVLFQAEADPLIRPMGNLVVRSLRRAVLRTRRLLDPDTSKFGAHMRNDFPEITKAAITRIQEGFAEIRELTLTGGSVPEILAKVWDFLDTAEPVAHARGKTLINAMTGRTPWQDFQEYVRSLRAVASAREEAIRLGDKDALELFEDSLDPSVEAAIFAWLGRGAETPQPDQRAALIVAGLREIERQPTARAFFEKMKDVTAGVTKTAPDPRLMRVQGTLATAILHGNAMRAAQDALTQSLGGFVDVKDAIAFNNLILRGVERPGADIDKAVAMITRMGMPYARDRHKMAVGAEAVAEKSRKLVAMGMDEASGQAWFVPRQQIDELNAAIGDAVKQFVPYGQEVEQMPLFGFWLGLQHGWRMSATAGFLLPKVSYTFTNILFGDLPVVMLHEGPITAAKVALKSLPAHLPFYARVFQKWHDATGTPSILGAFVSPRTGFIFGGREGTVQIGNRVMTAGQLRKQIVEDGILATQLGEEAYRSLDAVASSSWLSTFYRRWQHEILAHADLTSKRTRVALYLELLEQGVPHAEAAKRTKTAMLDWNHGFTRWEQGITLKLNAPFYRWWRLSLGQALGVMLDPVTRAADPTYWSKIATGRTRIALTRKHTQIQGAIPDWAAAYQLENDDGNLDEYDALMLALSGKADWARGRPQFAYLPGDAPKDYYEAFGNHSPAIQVIGPEASGIVTFNWWLNILAAGAAVSASAMYPEAVTTRDGLAWRLLEDNVTSMLGPFAFTAFSEAEQLKQQKKRVRVSPGEVRLLSQLDAMSGGLWESDCRQNPDTGRYEADAGNVFLIRSLPLIMQIPNIIASTDNPYGKDDFSKAFAVFLMRQLGIAKLYSRDPEADVERELRRMRAEVEREIDAAESRSGRRPPANR